MGGKKKTKLNEEVTMVLSESPKAIRSIVIHDTGEGGAPPMNFSQKRITRNERLLSKEEVEAN